MQNVKFSNCFVHCMYTFRFIVNINGYPFELSELTKNCIFQRILSLDFSKSVKNLKF